MNFDGRYHILLLENFELKIKEHLELDLIINIFNESDCLSQV